MHIVTCICKMSLTIIVGIQATIETSQQLEDTWYRWARWRKCRFITPWQQLDTCNLFFLILLKIGFFMIIVTFSILRLINLIPLNIQKSNLHPHIQIFSAFSKFVVQSSYLFCFNLILSEKYFKLFTFSCQRSSKKICIIITVGSVSINIHIPISPLLTSIHILIRFHYVSCSKTNDFNIGT